MEHLTKEEEIIRTHQVINLLSNQANQLIVPKRRSNILNLIQMRTSVRLTTENTKIGDSNSTDIYPYNYYVDNKKLDVSGKKQIAIYDFQMKEPSRVEIFWDNISETTDIIYSGDQVYEIPDNCSSVLFIIDAFSLHEGVKSENRVAEFDFELI